MTGAEMPRRYADYLNASPPDRSVSPADRSVSPADRDRNPADQDVSPPENDGPGWFRWALRLGPDTPGAMAEDLLTRPPKAGRTRIVAVDGQSGAGKTRFAADLAAAVSDRGATVDVVHTDDLLDGWDDQFTFWDRLVVQVLTPLRAGHAARYYRYDWIAGRFVDEPTTVEPADVVIVEGVSAARAAMREVADLTVFIGVSDKIAWTRLTARDPADAMPFLRTWKAREGEHFGADRTVQEVDVMIDGRLPHERRRANP
jgi:uridine kinase